jgi:hypothetical protein
MPIQGDQRASNPRSKIDSGRAILPSISGERRIRQKWEGVKTTRRKKNGQPVQQGEEFEHVRWYLQHVDGHVITCQPKAWMDTGGFAMYIQTVLATWWQKQQTSWTGPDEFPAKRLLLVCDNASVHKADELKKLMDQHGIILRFLPPNMTQWLQPLDRVVCGLIKIVRAPRAALGSGFETIEAGARTYFRGSIA